MRIPDDFHGYGIAQFEFVTPIFVILTFSRLLS
jgi:hypothetical protein